MSRIYYDRKFFHYPLKPLDALLKLGPVRAGSILASYPKARLQPIRPERSFEDWVVNRFGRLLFEIFFKTYTEKVWGMPTNEISADWAAQRIKGLSLTRRRLNALFGGRARRQGRGHQDPDRRVPVPPARPRPDVGGRPRPDPSAAAAPSTSTAGSSGSSTTARRSPRSSPSTRRAERRATSGEHFLSTLPIRDLIRAMDPPPPPEVLEAAESLKYRDFLTVVLIVDRAETFPDNWIYVHEPGVRVGRIQNFKNWSPDLVPDPSTSSLGLEYFCFEGDDLWTMPDADLIALGRREIDAIGLVPGRDGGRRLRGADAQGVSRSTTTPTRSTSR